MTLPARLALHFRLETALGIKNGDDYKRFAKEDIPKYVEIYCFIKGAEAAPVAGFESIYYNAVRKFSFQSMILMAAAGIGDTTKDWQDKILLVSRLADVLLISRTIEGKENNYENLRDISFALTKAVRGKTRTELENYVKTEWSKYFSQIGNLPKLAYGVTDKSDLLFVLARLAAYLEDELALKSKTGFVTFWKRDRGQWKTFDIEHIFKAGFDAAALPSGHGFADGKEYGEQRNLLGALILLPRSRNRSLQDKPYRDKVSAYATENVLAQTLTAAFYGNNPDVTRFLAANSGVVMAHVADFAKNDIGKRAALYTALAERVWASP